MALHGERSGHGPRVVLVHGFTQSYRCWGVEATDLARDHEVLRVDAPGHGRSSHVRADLEETAGLLVDVGGDATYLGYSMGARMCLTAALAHPGAVRGLVLIGGTAGIDDEQERTARARRDRSTAARITEIGIDAFLDEWLAQPLFAGLPPEARFLDERRNGSIEGLTASLELAGTGAQRPSWDRLHELAMPVLVVAGALDDKFSAIARRMVDAIGDKATLALIPDAGHAAHLEQPTAFLRALRPWLARHDL